MTQVRLRHIAQVNPACPAFDRLPLDAEVTFLPMEAVWPGERLDRSRIRTKAVVATGYTRFQDGDILVPKITPTFEASRSVLVDRLHNGIGAGTTELHVIRARQDVERRYLLYVMQSHPFLKCGVSEMYGVAGQKRVPDDFVRDFPVPLPSREEQRRIADFLDAETSHLDKLCHLKARMRNTLSLRKERLVDDVLGITGNRVGRFAPLRYVVRAVGVGIVITPAAWYVADGGVLALRGLNVTPGRINLGDVVRISAEGNALHRKSQLCHGDIVVVRTGQAGAAAVVPPELDGANCIDLVIVRPSDVVLPRFIEYTLNSDYAKSFVSEHSVGTIQAHFNVAAMKRMPIPSLDLTGQRHVIATLDRETSIIDRASSAIEQQLGVLGERRRALITAAVTGQLDVTTARSGVRV